MLRKTAVKRTKRKATAPQGHEPVVTDVSSSPVNRLFRVEFQIGERMCSLEVSQHREYDGTDRWQAPVLTIPAMNTGTGGIPSFTAALAAAQALCGQLERVIGTTDRNPALLPSGKVVPRRQ